MSKLIIVLLAVVAMHAGPVAAARLIGPPSEELTTGYNKAMRARAEERLADGRVAFRRIEDYFGADRERVVLRVDSDTDQDLKIGQQYIVGYSEVIPKPQFREIKVLDPDGPRLVRLRGIDARALLEDTPQTRFLFAAAVATAPAAQTQLLDAITVLLETGDRRTRPFAIAELMARPELYPLITAAEAQRLREALNPESEPRYRAPLLHVAQSIPAVAELPWLAEMQRRILDDCNPQFDLASHTPLLVITALRGLAAGGDKSDTSRLRPLLVSNSPGVTKAALDTLDALDKDSAQAAVVDALKTTGLHAETRRFFTMYLEARRNDRDNEPAGRTSPANTG